MIPKKPHVPDFQKATAKLRGAPTVALKLVRSFADKELITFRNRIENGEFESFDATPLSDDWLAFKIAHNLDLRTMIATKNYISKLKVFTKKSAKGYTIHIGFDESDVAIDPVTKKKTPFPLYILAAVQEFGSAKAHVPARPHWGPHLKDMAMRAGGVRLKIQQKVNPAPKGVK